MGAQGGIPRESYDQLRDKTFGGQTLANLKLLSMTKKPTEDGRYFCEADFNLAKMLQLGEDVRTDEEIERQTKEEVSKKKMKIDRSKPNAFIAIQVHYYTTIIYLID